MPELTKREKWLMDAAFMSGYERGFSDTKYHSPTLAFEDWLAEDAADAVTVEMVLPKDAPQS